MAVAQDQAELIGLQAVAWIAANDELLPVFQGATGACEADFREGMSDPTFQGAVLDFILLDDSWIMAFCDERNLAYEAPAQARAMLTGGEQVHWT